MKKTIADYPELVKEWHPTLNGNLMPNDIPAGSNKKYWWKCHNMHEWESIPNSRTFNKRSCPYCKNQKVCLDNCLATTHPEIAKEWHSIKNGDLTPNDIIAGSSKKCWWICSKNHEWETTCNGRTGMLKLGCPYCANKKVCKDNCLATICPKLIKEWHPTKNKKNPHDVIAGTSKKFWWICNKGHEWESTVNSRTFNKNGCPYCTNRKACKDNCLATICPELAKEWHPTKNGNLIPNDILSGTHSKFWWQCDKGHEWQAVCKSRTSTLKRNCPYCANKKVCKDNCLATICPEIAKEWHINKNGNLTPNDVIAGTHSKFWWQCDKGHEWQAICNDRVFTKVGCPYCTNRKVCKDNCLAAKFPEIAKEWHVNKNGNLTPNDVLPGVMNKFWWQCDKGHEWQATCNSRTGKGNNGCPICNESKGEKEIARILDILNIKYKREYRFSSCKNKRSLPFDFVLWSNNKIKIIEYHGIQHYKPSNFGSFTLCKHQNLKEIQNRDKIKKEWCANNDILFLEISYEEYSKIEEMLKTFLLF